MQPFKADDALVRMRRSLEWAGLISRTFAVLWIVGELAVLPRSRGCRRSSASPPQLPRP